MLKPTDLLLLRPEDVRGCIKRCVYAEVLVSTTNVTVARPLDASLVENADDEPVLTLFTALAEQRKVTKDEAATAPGRMMRAAIAGRVGGRMLIGQVVSVDAGGVYVKGTDRVFNIAMVDIEMEVPDVFAILMARQPDAVSTWTNADLQTGIDWVNGVLDSSTDESEGSPPSVERLMTGVPGGKSLSGKTIVQWVNLVTGLPNYTTLDHAVRFTCLERSGRSDTRNASSVGPTIGEDPTVTCLRGSGQGKRNRNDTEEPRAESRKQAKSTVRVSTSNFFGALPERLPGDDDDLSPRHVDTSQGTERRSAPDSERRRLIAMNGDPTLLRAYFAENPTPSVAASPALGRAEFRPHVTRVKAHELVTNARFEGMSPMEFCSFIAADESLEFQRIPSVLVRLFDLGFDAGGFSLMHFKTFTFRDEMAARTRREMVNMLDYSSGISLPPVPPPGDWEILYGAATNFVQYAKQVCDDTTIAVAAAVEAFIREQRLYDMWQPAELPTVLFWIDKMLGRYHRALTRDALNGSSERFDAPAWFDESNPLLQRYRASTLDARYRGGSSHGRTERGGPASGKATHKMSAEVIAAIPKRGPKQLCVRYMSNDGCKGRGDGATCSRPNCVHEKPATINATVAGYINNHLGGLCPGIGIE
ncbi:hypothetical protein PINS_up022426 [Pythium insidiosum]|nr:hypothetical protein PINS_up022425 [Pythium insidiosum]GLE10325.1 hypothetical protein PINS_up022426 [Pythium insidiosum]